MEGAYITVFSGRCTRKISIDDILFIERHLRKLRIVMADEEVEYYERLEHILPQLDERFFPCLQGCYINFQRVKSMELQQIIFEEGKSFYVGRANFLKTRKAYKKYCKKAHETKKNACNYNTNSI